MKSNEELADTDDTTLLVAEEESRNGAMTLMPNYSLRPAQVYREAFLMSILSTRHHLELLTLRNLERALPDVPSWVPNLFCPHREFSSDFSATGTGAFAEATLLPNDDVLKISAGKVVDTIATVSIPVPDAKLGSVLKALNTVIGREGDNKPIADDILRLISCDMVQDYMGPEAEQQGFPPLSRLKEKFAEVCEQTDNDGGMNHARFIPPAHVCGKRFIKTHGGYMGLALVAASPGDQVSIFLGCEALILLRPVPENPAFQKVVGTANVQGLMHGERLLGQAKAPWGWGG